jgi:DNA (cytosine-5)-methyltransferase 1
MNALSLFSGCGGDTLGMTRAGLTVKWYSEIIPTFQQSHELNFPDSTLVGGDIRKIPDEKFAELRGHVDTIFAGFPCQSFSHGGKKDPDDPRGQLFHQFVRATRLIEPKFIIGENVKGLTTRKTSDGGSFLDTILEAFRAIGYQCHIQVFRTDEFGVPQSRERLLIVGSKDPIASPFPPAPPGRRRVLSDILQFDMTGAIQVPKELIDEAGVPDDLILNGSGSPVGTPHPYLTLKVNERGATDKGLFTFSFGKRRSAIHCEIVDPRTCSKTLICTYDHQPRLFVAQKTPEGYFLRPYTIEEIKEIQGFPRDYKLAGDLKQQTIQLGNAVPPPLIQAVTEWVHRSSSLAAAAT